ncbi:DUF2931 family protein [Chryseobacterium jejuense]|uniref:DUF2931 family protein n=2 Tax=Chryseobacterium jejuense TaxID=445960 RepID=A0ABY0PD22_CHRJE|nr:DUF2931 family protein [Chryseobacterium jejuense]SDI13344.1 Protein of unknown function [Chryseobacterium jejuense]
MNKIIKYLLSFLFFTQISCQEKKDHKITTPMTKYEWSEGTSAALGYPMEVYKGGIDYEGGGWLSLDNGMTPGTYSWGTLSNGMSNNFKGLPIRLDFIWMSYMENQFYLIDKAVDTDKIREYLKKGFDVKVTNGSGDIEHMTYDKFGIGLAPGGVVVVWVAGIGYQKEIGRYQAEKVKIPESEIAKLDSHENRFWRKDYLDMVHSREQIIPAKVREENKGKPIPFGLWDTYRTRYSWKLAFELPEKAKLYPLANVKLTTINGEREQFETTKPPLSQNEMRAIPTKIVFDFVGADGKEYGGECSLNEKSSFEAFKTVFGDTPNSTKADIIVKVNEANSYLTIKLKGENGKEAFIKADSIEVF